MILRPLAREERVVLRVLRVEAAFDVAPALADGEEQAVARSAIGEAVRDARAGDEADRVACSKGDLARSLPGSTSRTTHSP